MTPSHPVLSRIQTLTVIPPLSDRRARLASKCMPNPKYLFCDSDVLIQIFSIKQTSLLKTLKTKYGIAPLVVPEVEEEVYWHKKFKSKFQQDMEKALGDGLLFRYVDSRDSTLLSCDANVQAQAEKIKIVVGRGEAWTIP